MTDRTCSVDGCDRDAVARGWCHKHWSRWKRNSAPIVVGRERGTPPPPCSIDGCADPGNGGWGWCAKHYRRYQRHGDPLATSRIVGDDVARFWSYVDKNGPTPEHRPELGPCWIWTGAVSADGYAIMGLRGASPYVARWAYEQFVGPIPDGHEPDHLCSVRACVNFETHLEPVTHAENVRRSTSFAAVNAAKTHCPQGHPYDQENTFIQASGGRLCRICQRAYEARRRAAKQT